MKRWELRQEKHAAFLEDRESRTKTRPARKALIGGLDDFTTPQSSSSWATMSNQGGGFGGFGGESDVKSSMRWAAADSLVEPGSGRSKISSNEGLKKGRAARDKKADLFSTTTPFPAAPYSPVPAVVAAPLSAGAGLIAESGRRRRARG